VAGDLWHWRNASVAVTCRISNAATATADGGTRVILELPLAYAISKGLSDQEVVGGRGIVRSHGSGGIDATWWLRLRARPGNQ